MTDHDYNGPYFCAHCYARIPDTCLDEFNCQHCGKEMGERDHLTAAQLKAKAAQTDEQIREWSALVKGRVS